MSRDRPFDVAKYWKYSYVRNPSPVHTSARAELLKELAKKERQLGIYPDPEVDLFMKVCSSLFHPFHRPIHHFHISTLDYLIILCISFIPTK